MGPLPHFIHPVAGFDLENQSPSVDFYETGNGCNGEAGRGRGKVSDVDESAYAGLAFLHVGPEGGHGGLLHQEDQVRSGEHIDSTASGVRRQGFVSYLDGGGTLGSYGDVLHERRPPGEPGGRVTSAALLMRSR